MDDSSIDSPEKYIAPLPKRLPIRGAGVIVDGPYLTPGESSFLLKWAVRITEKLDGNRIAVRVGRYVLTVEDMLGRRTIFYRIPARYAVYDIFDCKRGLFLDSYGIRSVMTDFKNGVLKYDGVSPDMFFPTPLAAEGHFQLEQIPGLLRESIYGRDEQTGETVQAMGIVVKHDLEQIPWMYTAGMLMANEMKSDVVYKASTVITTENYIDRSIPFVW